MPKQSKPRAGSLQFWPRKRVSKFLPRVNWPAIKKQSDTSSLMGFIGYKVGMKSAFVKENNFNQKEIHLNEKTGVEINPDGESVGEVRKAASFERKKIQDLNEGMNQVEVLGTVVQVVDPRFFNVCPECSK